jgi:hypothetical protein
MPAVCTSPSRPRANLAYVCGSHSLPAVAIPITDFHTWSFSPSFARRRFRCHRIWEWMSRAGAVDPAKRGARRTLRIPSHPHPADRLTTARRTGS